ncbi:MAG: hypothetical protein ABWY06_00145 [Pseudomonas sp.]|uniref:hypothetical protein n=1 Tax=Pseudomonas sp. TaxID=306 RepID=UPI0033912617
MDSNFHTGFSKDPAFSIQPPRVGHLLGSLLLIALLPALAAAYEAVPGEPLSRPATALVAVQDDAMWVLLMEEPSSYMQRTHERLVNRDFQAAAGDLRRVGAYLRLAAGNAGEHYRSGLQAAAVELDAGAERLIQRPAERGDEPQALHAVFARAENAIAADQHAKASTALAAHRPDVAGRYLSASLQHLENAGRWAGAQAATSASGDGQAVRALADQMLRGHVDAGQQAHDGLNWVRDEVQKLEQVLSPRTPTAFGDWAPMPQAVQRLRF